MSPCNPSLVGRCSRWPQLPLRSPFSPPVAMTRRKGPAAPSPAAPPLRRPMAPPRSPAPSTSSTSPAGRAPPHMPTSQPRSPAQRSTRSRGRPTTTRSARQRVGRATSMWCWSTAPPSRGSRPWEYWPSWATCPTCSTWPISTRATAGTRRTRALPPPITVAPASSTARTWCPPRPPRGPSSSPWRRSTRGRWRCSIIRAA